VSLIRKQIGEKDNLIKNLQIEVGKEIVIVNKAIDPKVIVNKATVLKAIANKATDPKVIEDQIEIEKIAEIIEIDQIGIIDQITGIIDERNEPRKVRKTKLTIILNQRKRK